METTAAKSEATWRKTKHVRVRGRGESNFTFSLSPKWGSHEGGNFRVDKASESQPPDSVIYCDINVSTSHNRFTAPRNWVPCGVYFTFYGLRKFFSNLTTLRFSRFLPPNHDCFACILLENGVSPTSLYDFRAFCVLYFVNKEALSLNVTAWNARINPSLHAWYRIACT